VVILLTESCEGSRYIYELYYEKEAISKQLYDWLLKNGYADANLIAKWKKQGYEKVVHFFDYVIFWIC
jgi:bud site selection protein 31